MDFELAEAAAEGDVLLGRDTLVANRQHAVVQQGLMNTVKLLIVIETREIGTDHLGAKHVRKGPNLDIHSSLLPPAGFDCKKYLMMQDL